MGGVVCLSRDCCEPIIFLLAADREGRVSVVGRAVGFSMNRQEIVFMSVGWGSEGCMPANRGKKYEKGNRSHRDSPGTPIVGWRAELRLIASTAM